MFASVFRFFHSCFWRLLLQFAFNLVIPDHNADAYRSPFLASDVPGNALDVLIAKYLLSGLNRWDSNYFITISINGYQRDDHLAFFPLYPLTVRVIASFLETIAFGTINTTSSVLLASVFLNVLLFAIAAASLFRLTTTLFNNNRIAHSTVYWFCYNPASIFFTANYSESLFAALSFFAMSLIALSKSQLKSTTAAATLLGLASLTRSNGVVAIAFLVHSQLNTLYSEFRIYSQHHEVIETRRATAKKSKPMTKGSDYLIIGSNKGRRASSSTNVLESTLEKGDMLRATASRAILIVFAGLIALAPFLAYQMFAYMHFCEGSDVGLVRDSGNSVRDWCGRVPTLRLASGLPPLALVYSLIQEKFWDVGFLRYYQLKQTPNFLLCAPLVAIVYFAFVTFLKKNSHLPWSLGLGVEDNCSKRRNSIYNCEQVFPYICHAFFLVNFGLAFIHVQVITRLVCSSSPVLYWVAASLTPESRPYKMMRLYFGIYFVVGIFMHSNFLPWT